MTGVVTIYVLCDSRESDPVKRVRYVGRTVRTIAARLRCHRFTALHGDSLYRSRWMCSVYAAGGTILIEPVAVVPSEQADAAEIDFIARYRTNGCQLTNLTDGGGGILNATHETRAKISAKARGRKATPETRAKISAWQKGRPRPYMDTTKSRARIVALNISRRGKPGRPLTPENRAKLLAAAVGRTPSAETREKMSAAQRRRRTTAETRAKMSASHTGKIRSIEHCAKLSAARLGKPLTLEHRAKLSEARRRRSPASDATRAKMAASQNAAHQRRKHEAEA